MNTRAPFWLGLALLAGLGGCQIQPVTPVDRARLAAGPVECRRVLSQDEALVRDLAEEQMNQGQWYAALAQTDTMAPNHADVLVLRAHILRQLNPTEAKPVYERLLNTCRDAQARHGLGLMAAKQGRHQEAVDFLKVSAERLPTDAQIRHDYGVALLHLNQDERARFELRTAHELAPDQGAPRFTLMLLSLLVNDTQAWQQQRGTWQPDVATRLDLARACTQMAKIREARQPVARTCLIDPTL